MIAVTNGANSRIELSAKRNCWTNSVPYGYGGRIADMIVLPVRIIMSPTCSSRFFVGKNALSATARTNYPPLSGAEHYATCMWRASADALRKRCSPDETGACIVWTLAVVPSGRRVREECAPRSADRPCVRRSHRVRLRQQRRAPGQERARSQLQGRGRRGEVPGQAVAREAVPDGHRRQERRPE